MGEIFGFSIGYALVPPRQKRSLNKFVKSAIGIVNDSAVIRRVLAFTRRKYEKNIGCSGSVVDVGLRIDPSTVA